MVIRGRVNFLWERWQQFTRPAGVIRDDIRRQEAQLLISLLGALLVVAPVILLFWIVGNPDYPATPYLSGGMFAALVLAFGFSRTRRYRIGAYILVFALFGLILSIYVTAPGPLPERMLVLMYLTVALLLANLLLPLWGMVMVAGLSLFVAGLFFFLPGLPFSHAYTYITFTGLMFALLLVSRIMRQQDLRRCVKAWNVTRR